MSYKTRKAFHAYILRQDDARRLGYWRESGDLGAWSSSALGAYIIENEDDSLTRDQLNDIVSEIKLVLSESVYQALNEDHFDNFYDLKQLVRWVDRLEGE